MEFCTFVLRYKLMDFRTSHTKTLRLSRTAFWDIDLTKLDADLYSEYTIIRVLERGTEEDISQIIQYFGTERIIQTLSTAKHLQPRAIALGEKLFGLTASQFACSKQPQRATSYSQY